MKYYIDSEFDGHNGPLISIAIVREDSFSAYYITRHGAREKWVRENVMPRLRGVGENPAIMLDNLRENTVGHLLLDFLKGDEEPLIYADSPVDVARFTGLISTNAAGEYQYVDIPLLQFAVFDIDVYPTPLPGAVQHNAWRDAMALAAQLRLVDKAND